MWQLTLGYINSLNSNRIQALSCDVLFTDIDYMLTQILGNPRAFNVVFKTLSPGLGPTWSSLVTRIAIMAHG